MDDKSIVQFILVILHVTFIASEISQIVVLQSDCNEWSNLFHWLLNNHELWNSDAHMLFEG
jgi:hypothetical protein